MYILFRILRFATQRQATKCRHTVLTQTFRGSCLPGLPLALPPSTTDDRLRRLLTPVSVIHVMHKRFYVQRQHIIHSLDTLLYQLHTLSFFLSPSLWLYVCRVVSQFQCSKPREWDPSRSLRFFYALVIFLNLPSLWNHSTQGAAEGRAIILDFIGMSYTPPKVQLFCLDLLILSLQLLLTTIAYETSVYHVSEDSNVQDILLPEPPYPTSIPLFNAPAETPPSSPSTLNLPLPLPKVAASIPLVIDLRLQSIMIHLVNPPPPPRTTNSDSVLPLPNTTPWPIPGMRMLLRAGRQLRAGRPAATGAREMRMPGGIDNGPG